MLTMVLENVGSGKAVKQVEYLLGIDIGTSGCKLAAFTREGKVVYQLTQAYEVLHPAPGYAEQNPQEWWDAVCRNVRQMFADSEIQPEQIKGIGVAGQSGSAVAVDRNGRVLRNAILWLDQRSQPQYDALKDTVGEDVIFAVSGNPLAPTYTTGKILWMKQHEPDLYKSAYKYLQSNSFIVYKLTGIMTHDLSQGNGIHAFDIERGEWDYTLCERMGIEPRLLADLYGCSDVVGEVTDMASAETGLAKGTPVVAGGLDAACGTLGAGVLHPGQTQEQGGQAGGMSIVMEQAVKHKKLILSSHVVSGTWLLQGGTVGGGSLNWFKRELIDAWGTGLEAGLAGATAGSSPHPIVSFETLNIEAERVPPGSDGLLFLPYMAGERSPIWDIHAKGVFLGLSYEKTKAHMIRAIMEGCAYALKHNLQTAEEAGVVVSELYSMGGAANSLIWSQIKADITGKRVKIPSSDTATTLGAAILAGVGIGMYRSFDEAVQSTLQIKRVHEPNAAFGAKYQHYYPIYLEAYQRLKDLFPRLELS